LALASQVLAKHSCDAPARLLAGEAWLALQNRNEAAAALDKAEGCNARSATTRFLRARMLATENKWAFSKLELGEVLRIDPGFAGARIALLRSFMTEGRPEMALDALNDLYRLYEGNINAGRLLLRRKNGAGDERGGMYAMERNWALLASGDYTHALVSIESGIARSRSAELLLQRAVAGFEAGKAEANVFLEEALRLNPASRASLRARVSLEAKPPASQWAQLAPALAEDIRPSVSGVELLDLPGEVVRSAFVLREPYPNL
jgi:tetratricopeptide (TPR) repeat protein